MTVSWFQTWCLPLSSLILLAASLACLFSVIRLSRIAGVLRGSIKGDNAAPGKSLEEDDFRRIAQAATEAAIAGVIPISLNRGPLL